MGRGRKPRERCPKGHELRNVRRNGGKLVRYCLVCNRERVAKTRARKMVIALVGQAPGPKGDPRKPLVGAAGRKIAALLGMKWSEYLERTARANVFFRHQGKNGKGDAFPMIEARRRARRMRFAKATRAVVFFGKATAAAFGFARNDFFEPLAVMIKDDGRIGPPGRVVFGFVAPHPSGINLWWNDEENRLIAAAEFSDLVSRVEREGE